MEQSSIVVQLLWVTCPTIAILYQLKLSGRKLAEERAHKKPDESSSPALPCREPSPL